MKLSIIILNRDFYQINNLNQFKKLKTTFLFIYYLLKLY